HDNWLCYHVLTASWALTGVVTVAVAWRRERAGDSGTSLPGTTPLLFPFVVVRRVVLILAVLVAALGLRGLDADPVRPWWLAGAVLAVGAMLALVAAWRRRAAWAFASGLTVNVAASLVLWHFHKGQVLAEWWVPLVQANVLAGAVVALLWLTGRRLLRHDGPQPLLEVQLGLCLVGLAVLLVGPGAWLIAQPSPVPEHVRQAGDVAGWAALALTAVAAAWRLREWAARAGLHVLCGLGLGLGGLAACSAGWWDRGDWLAYHV